jgi:hypothetical protein
MDNGDIILYRYLDGELSVGEKEDLEKQLETNEALRSSLERLRETREAVRYYGLHQQVGNIHADMMKELSFTRQRKNSPRKIIRYTIAVAASLLLVVAAYVVYNFITLSSDKVFASRFQSYELVNMRGNQADETAMEQAYRQKDFRQVIAIQGKNKYESAEENFLSGMASMELKDNTHAIEYFKKVIEVNKKSGKTQFKDEAEYYLALSYIRNKDYDYALDLLKSIKQDTGHAYHKKVTPKLLRQVRMLKWR